MTTTVQRDWTDAEREQYLADVRECGWVAREARLLIEENVPQDSERWQTHAERKRALLERIAADQNRP